MDRIEGTVYAILAIMFAILIDMHGVGYKIGSDGIMLMVRWHLFE